ncbi:hypothetical protein CWS43_05520 [Rahnella sp. AA]|nr:hypothetical protein CWS43_05520 [Rahnella sp. AA]
MVFEQKRNKYQKGSVRSITQIISRIEIMKTVFRSKIAKKNGTLKAPFYIRYRQSFMFQE